MSSPALDHEANLREIRSWPLEEQLALVRTLAEQLTPAVAEEPRSHSPSSQLAGILTTDAPPPSDEDVARWLDERRIEKYG